MCLFYTKPSNEVFYFLEWPHTPNTISLIPKNCADNGAEEYYEDVVPIEAMHHQRQIQPVKQGGEECIEEISWKQQLAQLNVVLKHADFYLSDQLVVSADFLLLNQTQLT